MTAGKREREKEREEKEEEEELNFYKGVCGFSADAPANARLPL